MVVSHPPRVTPRDDFFLHPPGVTKPSVVGVRIGDTYWHAAWIVTPSDSGGWPSPDGDRLPDDEES